MYEQSKMLHQMQKSMSYGDASRQSFMKSSLLNQMRNMSTLILVVLKRNHHESSSELKSKIPENHHPFLIVTLTPTFH